MNFYGIRDILKKELDEDQCPDSDSYADWESYQDWASYRDWAITLKERIIKQITFEYSPTEELELED